MSVDTMSPSSAIHPHHHRSKSLECRGQGADSPPSSTSDDSTQALLEKIDKLLKKLLGSSAADDDASADPADDSSSTNNQQLQEMLAFFAQLFQSMQQPDDGSGSDGDDATPGVGGIGGGGGGPPVLARTGGGGVGGPSAGAAAPGSAAAPAVDAAAPAAGGADWGTLNTAPQTHANTPQQSSQVAAQYMTNLKQDFGLTDAQAAGVVGNLWHESGGMNSGISQGGAIGSFGAHQDDNAHGIGIAQWGGSRADGLLQYAATHKDANGKPLDPTSQAANYGFLKQELQGPYAHAIAAVKGTNDVASATAAFANAYEQPTDPQMASRIAYANQALASVAS